MNNATATAARQRIADSTKVMHTAGMNRLQWNLILFEVGCLFVEKWVKDARLQKCLLENENLGFWGWWMVQYMDDDKELLTRSISTVGSYFRNKMLLLKVPELFSQFEYYMQRINVKEVYEKI